MPVREKSRQGARGFGNERAAGLTPLTSHLGDEINIMCMGCWEDAGRPYKASDAALEWAPRFEAADHFGALHIVVEDWNLDDDNIAFCRTQNPTPDEVALLDALQAMSTEERWACAILGEDPKFRPEIR